MRRLRAEECRCGCGKDRCYPIGPDREEAVLVRQLLRDHVAWADRYGRTGRIAKTAAAAERLLTKIELALAAKEKA